MSLNKIHPDLLLAESLIYKPSGLILQSLKIENESVDYGASEFTIKNRFIKFRVGRVTPTKVGQFVTFWKRGDKGPIIPYEDKDFFNFLIVSVRAENHFGHFIFPKAIICEKGIVTSSKKEGKRALRVYPPWDKTKNSQAKKTQAWQLKYFINFSNKIDFENVPLLFESNQC